MIIGIGVDLCDIEKMEEILNNTSFLARFYAQEEICYIQNKNMAAAQSAAAIFAAKEAAAKALGTGMTKVIMKEIVVLHEGNGKPYLEFKGKTLHLFEKLGGARALLSISHEKTMAIAMVVLEGA